MVEPDGVDSGLSESRSARIGAALPTPYCSCMRSNPCRTGDEVGTI